MSENPTVVLFNGGITVEVPLVWHEEFLPYRWDWDRWCNHADGCAQCAYHQDHMNAGHCIVPDPCPVGMEMLADLRTSMESQRADAMAN